MSDLIELKTCTKCKDTKLSNTDYFYKLKSAKDGLTSWCKECLRKYSYKRSIENKEQILSQKRKRYAEDEEHRKKKLESKRFENRRPQRKEYYKKYQQKNKEKFIEYQKLRKANKLHDITEQEWLDCLEFFNDSCAYCGMTEEQSFITFGQQLHKEHVEHNGANDIANCVPSCKGCNSQKWEYGLNEWYNENNSIYSKRRYNKIIKWLMSFVKV